MKLPSKFLPPRPTSSTAALVALALATGSALAVDGVWVVNAGGGNWDATGKWVDENIPGGVGATADFQVSRSSGNIDVFLNGNRTIGILKLGFFGDARGLNLRSSGKLILDNGASDAVINFRDGGGNVSINPDSTELLSNLLINNLDDGGNKGFFFTSGLFSTNGHLTITNTSHPNSRTKFNGVISDGAAGNSITYNQTGGWSEFTNNGNTFSGTTTNGGGLLHLGNTAGISLALQNSALNTTGSIAGTATVGLRLFAGINSLTLGGLIGDKNFAATGGVFSTASANYNLVTALTLNPGTGKSHSYSGTIEDGAVGMTLTKTGAGTQTLSNSNTYTGATAINEGTLVITGATQSTSAITFGGGVLGLDIASTVTAASATVDFSGESVLVTGAPTLPSYTLLTALSIPGTAPTLAAPAPSGYELQVVSNQLLLVQIGGGSAYDTWAEVNAPTGTPADDFDGDGVSNAVEFVLGGDKDTNDLDKLPVIDTDGTDMTFTFERDQTSIEAGTTVTIEVSTDLVNWNALLSPYAVPDSATGVVNPGVTVVKDSPVAGTDTVTLTIPQAPETKKFARLKVVITL